jgi:uncharacterized protein YukJ
MAINNYGVLKGRAFDRQRATSHSEHFQILDKQGVMNHTALLSIPNQVKHRAKYCFMQTDDFHHSITDAIEQAALENGFYRTYFNSRRNCA